MPISKLTQLYCDLTEAAELPFPPPNHGALFDYASQALRGIELYSPNKTAGAYTDGRHVQLAPDNNSLAVYFRDGDNVYRLTLEHVST